MPTMKTVLAGSNKTMANKAIGKISQVIGAVVDVEFDGELPAIQNAIKHPTTIDMMKVNAQLGRQVLDRMVGFTISPVLWKQFFHGGKNKSGLSAGRCQTPALRLVYENQMEIDAEPGKKVFETMEPNLAARVRMRKL